MPSNNSNSNSSNSNSNSSGQIAILFIAFPNFNTLDVNGPVDVFGNSSLRPSNGAPRPFTITVAGVMPSTTSCEGINIAPHISIDKALSTIEDYDILIMPGGLTKAIIDGLHAGTFDAIVYLLQAFSKLGPSKSLNGEKRVLMSVCTGAFFLAHAGLFCGLECTTHYLSILSPNGDRPFKKMLDSFTAKHLGTRPAVVVPSNPSQNFRYCEIQDMPSDVGSVRVISAGGISCGLDASIYLLRLLKGKKIASEVCDVMQYAWRSM